MIRVQYKRHAGLGNKLFPVARALVASLISGIPLVNPLWFSPRGAGLVRGGVDYGRFLGKIWLYGNFSTFPGSLPLVHGFFSRKRSVKVSDLNEFMGIHERMGDEVDYVFSWNTCHNFSDLWIHRQFIKNVVFQAAIPKLTLPSIGPYIVVNPRLGNDFVSAEDPRAGYRKNPKVFWESGLNEVMRRTWIRDVVIVSDGPRSQSELLFSQPIHVVENATAIEDLWTLANASAIVASGNSSFSAWGGFLSGSSLYCSKVSHFASYGLNYECLD
jgi:hypothetical protein